MQSQKRNVPHVSRSALGDGGLAMLMGDLLSLRQLELPVKVIVFRNDALAFVQLEMKVAGILDKRSDGGHHPKNERAASMNPEANAHKYSHLPCVVWRAT